MGVFSAAVPILSPIDHRLTGLLPAWLALLVWGLIGGALSTTLYGITAPQDRLANVRSRCKIAQERLGLLKPDETEFKAALALAIESVWLSLKELLLVSGPALAACIPILFLAGYLDRAYLGGFPNAGILKGWEVVFSIGALASGLSLKRLSARA
jgi:hypothetical protein